MFRTRASLRLACAGLLATALTGQVAPDAVWDSNQQGPATAAPRFDLASTNAFLRQTERLAAVQQSAASAACLLLQSLATGSTMRAGPDRKLQQQTIAPWRSTQGDSGWFATANRDPVTLREQLLLTLAFTEAMARSNYSLLRPNVERAAAAGADAITAASGVSAEDLALLAVCANRLDKALPGQQVHAERCRAAIQQVRAQFAFGSSRRGDAALHLTDVLLGAKEPAALTVARCWPANPAADPLHTFLGVLALHTTDAGTWQRETALLSKLLAARVADGDDAGSWPATPGLDVTTTTLLLATATAFANLDPFAPPAPARATIGAAGPGTWILP